MTNNPPAIDAESGRINSKILELCSKPAPANTNPTLIGVGLYTHVAQPREDSNSAPKPVFLPLGGLNKVQSIRPINQQTQPDKEVAAVYKQLQEALEAEEKLWRGTMIQWAREGTVRTILLNQVSPPSKRSMETP
jgi:hypothetical protein